MRTCTWAPTVFQGTQVVERKTTPSSIPSGEDLYGLTTGLVQQYEALGYSDLLIAQRWWGSGTDIEASSLDCLAMTSAFAACTQHMNLITAIHPGFFQPTVIAKWAATLSRMTGGRWSINVTSGWNMQEFEMYGIDQLQHDQRYLRSAEFIQVLRQAWTETEFTFNGNFYHADQLRVEPRPVGNLEVFQGGQSTAAINMAAAHSDWMFLNGGSPERVGNIINQVRKAAAASGRQVRFAMYAIPLCRPSDAAAWEEIDAMLASVDQALLAQRQARLARGAKGMWQGDDDALGALDTNEGYVPRLIGSPETIAERVQLYRNLGVEMLHLDARDTLFNQEVLPWLSSL